MILTEKKYILGKQYFKSQDEMQDLFGDFPDVLSNTLEIAKQCNLSIEPDGYFLPEYPVPDGQDFDTHLKSLVEESLGNLILNLIRVR
ncbi:MAG: hypothetical protein Ct9H90mP6_00470 [Gammaproteobacteria bacterium]|nr:MAG: hypothetical protein Ct9H90mP6_00470 [Gammaproteobacteria bacterium]